MCLMYITIFHIYHTQVTYGYSNYGYTVYHMATDLIGWFLISTIFNILVTSRSPLSRSRLGPLKGEPAQAFTWLFCSFFFFSVTLDPTNRNPSWPFWLLWAADRVGGHLRVSYTKCWFIIIRKILVERFWIFK